MKIVVFDSDPTVRTVFDPALAGMEVIYDDGPVSKDVLTAHADAEIVSLFVSSIFRKEHIDLVPKLRYIVARSTGVDHIDYAYAREKGIIVCNVPKYGQRTVAEFTFALMLSLSRQLQEAAYHVRIEGKFDIAALEGFELFGKTLGVVGTGSIGRTVVRIAQGFGMRVRMFDMHPDSALENEEATYVPLDRLLSESDIVTLHVPYTPKNHHMLNSDTIAKMKPGSYLINTARGELIDTQALLEALQSGRIAGAGLDVLEGERGLKAEMELVRSSGSINELQSVVEDHLLIDTPHVIVTPHIAFFTREAYKEILATSLDNITQCIAGTPANEVLP